MAGIATLFAFARELWALFKKPRYRALLFWVAVILLVGTVFYQRVEGWSWLDSLYFSVITLSTVGYGDLSPTTPESKIFTMVYIFLGLNIFVSFVAGLAKERQEIYQSRVAKHAGDKDDRES